MEAASESNPSHRISPKILVDDQAEIFDETESGLTCDEAIERVGFGRFQILMLFFAGTCWIGDAIEMMLLSFLSRSVRCEWGLTSTQEAMISTVVFLGMLVGAFLWGQISDRYGRRMSYLLSMLFLSVFGFLSALAPSYAFLLVCRTFVGMGAGGTHVVVTLFVEFLPVSRRALYVMLLDAFWSAGTLAGVAAAWIVLPKADEGVEILMSSWNMHCIGWRWMLALVSLPLILLTLVYPIVPESSRFLIASGQSDQAVETLNLVARVNGSLPLPYGCLKSPNVEAEKKASAGLLHPSLRVTTLMLWALWLGGTFSYYGAVLLPASLLQHQRATGECEIQETVRSLVTRSEEDYMCAIFTNDDFVRILIDTAAELPGVLLVLYMLDKIGRKTGLGSAMLASGFLLALMGLLPCFTELLDVSMFLMRGLVTGALQGMFVYTPEVYPTLLRGAGLGTASSFGRIGGMITPFFAQVLLEEVSISMALYSYAAVMGLCGAMCFLLPIETKGRELEDSVTNSSFIRLEINKSELETINPDEHEKFGKETYRSESLSPMSQ